jgi:hypothetical protein
MIKKKTILLEDLQKNFRRKVYHAQNKRLIESISNSVIDEIKEIYEHARDFEITRAEGLITISFVLDGTNTSFEEVEGDMNNIADAYNLIVSDIGSFCPEGEDIECDDYLRTGQPVDFCVSFESIDSQLNDD